jgi:hypothetical protein
MGLLLNLLLTLLDQLVAGTVTALILMRFFPAARGMAANKQR